MNLKMIQKHRDAFNYLVADPENHTVLYAHNHKGEISGWWPLDLSAWSGYSDTLEIVINDKFVEYRKALVEGKTLQYNVNTWTFPEIKGKNWVDVNPTTDIKVIFTKYGKDNIRIKPEEPKFKVGDWVVTNGNKKQQVTEGFLGLYNENYHHLKTSTVFWQPKEGEWCWFWNKDRIPAISQLVKIEPEGNRKYFAKFPGIPHPLGAYYDFCEPFIGELPTTLKD